MTQDTLTLYKLIILHMLDRVSFPLTQAQLSGFMLEKEYTNFLTLQQVFCELLDTGLVSANVTHNRTYLSITKEGAETLHFFNNRISPAIKQDIEQYLKENELSLRNEFSIQADYYRASSGEYEAHLVAYEKKIKLMDITLSVPTQDTAATICDNWQKKNQEIYQYLISQLF